MKKIIVGRKVEYLEVFEIDIDEFVTIRDDLDLCQRLLWAADPILTQRLKTQCEKGKAPIKFLYRVLDHITMNPVIPTGEHLPTKGLDECPRYNDVKEMNDEHTIQKRK